MVSSSESAARELQSSEAESRTLSKQEVMSSVDAGDLLAQNQRLLAENDRLARELTRWRNLLMDDPGDRLYRSQDDSWWSVVDVDGLPELHRASPPG